MSRSKKIFVASAVAFFLILAYIVWDISSRTTFPGAPQVKTESDEQAADSAVSRPDTLP